MKTEHVSLSSRITTWRRACRRRFLRWLLPCFAPFLPLGLWADLAQAAPRCDPSNRLLVRPAAGADLTDLHAALGTTVLRTFPGIGGLQVVQLPAGADGADIIAAYEGSGKVAYAEPDQTVRALAEPNDFRFWDGTLWGLRNTGAYGGTPGADINAPRAWDVRTGTDSIVVAVVDTGVRHTHEDLAANLWRNPGESGRNALGLDRSGNALDDDGNGFVDDVHGINAILGTGLPWDDHGHGTHVGGTVGAVGGNSVGITGVAWRAQVMHCKFLDATGHGTISDAITCLDYARNKGARVVNASWGDYTTFASQALHDAIDSLRRAGVLFVAACGNDGTDNDSRPLYPASYPLDNIIAVAATDRTDGRAWFSNHGANTVHLGAPGAAVFSAWNGSNADYRYLDGTSMAAPHVAAACALVWAQYPGESHRQIKQRVLAGTTPLSALAGRTVTGGRLDLYKALSASAPPPGKPVLTVSAADTSAAETGPDPGAFVISRTGATTSTLTVRYAMSGTAQNGADYEFLSGVLTIPANVATATVTVKPIDDAQTETTESVVLALTPTADYAVGSPGSATVALADNDTVLPPLPGL